MTTTEIAVLPAGPELDALIDALVFGHAPDELCIGEILDYDGDPLCGRCGYAPAGWDTPFAHKRQAPAYSTDWGAAGLALDHFTKPPNWGVQVTSPLDRIDPEWQCIIDRGIGGGVQATGRTGPEAIGQAAKLMAARHPDLIEQLVLTRKPSQSRPNGSITAYGKPSGKAWCPSSTNGRAGLRSRVVVRRETAV